MFFNDDIAVVIAVAPWISSFEWISLPWRLTDGLAEYNCFDKMFVLMVIMLVSVVSQSASLFGQYS